MSVAARVAEEMSVKLGNEVSENSLSCVCVINKVLCKAKAHNLTKPRATILSKKKEQPWVEFKPTTLCSLGLNVLPTELPGQLSRSRVVGMFIKQLVHVVWENVYTSTA